MDDYQAHAKSLHRRAVEAHGRWLADLSPKQRAKLRDLGVLNPPDDSHEVGGHSPWQTGDLAESSRARVDYDPATHLDSGTASFADRFGIPLEKAGAIMRWHLAATEAALRQKEGDLLAIVVGGLIGSKNTRIATAGLAYAAELDAVNGLGCQADYARSLGVSRSAISKSVKAWKRSLGLRTSSHQKSDRACRTYSDIGLANHWRRQKVTASDLLQRLKKHRQSDPSLS